MKNDDLGQKCKGQEQEWSLVHPNNLPLYVRLDGRSFSKVLKNCDKPFDRWITYAMQDTTMALMNHFGAQVGFSQSDEISLLFLPSDNPLYEHPFAGKQQKITSTFASYATWQFNNMVSDKLTSPATFDCRTVSCTLDDAKLHFLWRHQDACRNAIQAVAQDFAKCFNSGHPLYSHSMIQSVAYGWIAKHQDIDDTKIKLDKKNISQQLELINNCVNFNDFEAEFKYGTLAIKEADGIKEYHPEKIYHFLAGKIDELSRR